MEFAPGNARIVLHLPYSYDNSTNYPVNPNQPPKRVVYGERSSDEICELGLQILTRQTNDLKVLQEAAALHRSELLEEQLRERIAFNADDAEALTRFGMILLMQKRHPEARPHLERAIKVRPDFAEAHHNKGVFLRLNGQPNEARQEFETALRLDPRFPKTHQQLGFAFADLGDAAHAGRSFEKALQLEPADTVARTALREIRQFIKSSQRSN